MFRNNASNLGYKIKNQNRYKYQRIFIQDNYLWSKIRSIKDVDNKVFIPIKTESGSYKTHFGLSHNCDDIENSDDNRSKSKRDFLRSEWFEKDVLFVGGEEGSVTDIVIIGTIIGSESLLNALSNPIEYPDWNRKIFKAVYKFSSSPLWDEWARLYKDRFNDNRIQTAKNFFEVNREEMLDGTEVLWPEGDPYYNNMIEMYFRPAAFQTEKQNSGLDPTKILITYDQLHFTNFNDIEVSKVLKSRRRTIFYGALDPSLGKKADSGDYSCVVTIAKDTQTGYLFVTNIEMARRSVEEQINSIIKSHKKYNYRLFGVETNAFQYVVAEDLRKKSGRTIPVRELNNYHDKKLRFEGIIPF